MTIRPRALRTVHGARTRLRDLASAGRHQAELDAGAATTAAANAASHLDRTIDECRARMQEASITGLIRIAAEVEASRAEVACAEAACAAATSALDLASEALARRERELRSVERAIDQAMAVRTEAHARGEQRLSDDLGSRRRWP